MHITSGIDWTDAKRKGWTVRETERWQTPIEKGGAASGGFLVKKRKGKECEQCPIPPGSVLNPVARLSTKIGGGKPEEKKGKATAEKQANIMLYIPTAAQRTQGVETTTSQASNS